MKPLLNSADTIAAISSAVGPAARMIVRVSGECALDFARQLGVSNTGQAGSASRCRLSWSGLLVPAWVYVFQSPRSYTGEHLVEFHIPGNPLLAKMLLEHILHLGARPADAGEFTARAYFNSRLDLTAAEGVAAAIGASGASQLRAARQLLAGELSRRLRPAMESLADTLALVEAGIDFSGEDVTFLTGSQIRERIGDVVRQIDELLASRARFEPAGHEPAFVLIGRPNAGKSTLLNALARSNRAVVSPIAGTTRDALSAEVELPRGFVRVLDVAGLESEDDPASPRIVARQMHDRALWTLEQSDYVIHVVDSADRSPPIKLPRNADIVVRTKADLHPDYQATAECIIVSAKTGRGMDALRAALDRLAFGADSPAEGLALNSRHVSSLEESRAILDRALDATDAGLEVIAFELRHALDALGSILGSVTPDDLLGRIFSGFCIGK